MGVIVIVKTEQRKYHFFTQKVVEMPYLKAKTSLFTPLISSFKYVFIVFFEKSDAKIINIHFVPNPSKKFIKYNRQKHDQIEKNTLFS